ncbi:putative toxin-antitoxin system toxin component, PIN family [Candidatus Daviesbacteria bacterium RIFCSPHIGHO2_02_FULL_39_12]|uniref:Putative toxin-antitoxin system toxin component, PIN family n=1 Tax=Candidatus Daviesbacteria bacterium RIFCSPHIGHO2_02_FULL_39_12 TaxID=1797770 RepID=A0A1F5J9F7_9BACT|nr:MAG: putative toxin-antitoxin system toxin component, PIN family [Candidatus Daviesbacteria bacterium RIFCSPHIGHO2_02_FULL_39_12]
MASNPKNIDKAFIDSSVLIAAAISSAGSARDLIMKALRGELKAIISDLVLEETQRNLTNKASKALPALQLFLEVLNPEVVRPSKTLVLKVAKVVEAKDAPIVAGAISSKADYLVSFDRKHLLQHKKEIETNFKVKVVTPDELIPIFMGMTRKNA